MKKPLRVFIPFLASAVASHAAISVPTTQVYDDTTNANAVDAVAGIGLVTSGSAAETALNNYKAVFSNAYTSGIGGVLRFDGWTAEVGDATSTLNNGMATTYGLGSTLTITRTSGEYQFDSSPTTLGTPISGSMYLRTAGEQFHTFNFGTPLSVVGFTVLSRNSFRTVQATVTYLDGSSDVISGENVAAGAGNDDTFFGFTAPNGKAIVSLRVEATDTGETNNNYFAIDDLGYVISPIPEASTAMLAMGGLAMAAIRRRRH